MESPHTPPSIEMAICADFKPGIEMRTKAESLPAQSHLAPFLLTCQAPRQAPISTGPELTLGEFPGVNKAPGTQTALPVPRYPFFAEGQGVTQRKDARALTCARCLSWHFTFQPVSKSTFIFLKYVTSALSFHNKPKPNPGHVPISATSHSLYPQRP